MSERLHWYDDEADNSPWIKAFADLRQRAAYEATVISTSRQSRWRSTGTQRKRWATATTFLNKPNGAG